MGIFQKASRLKLKIETTRGPLNVEDLWDLPLTTTKPGPCLDELYKTFNRQLKETETESLVVSSNKVNELLQLKFDIVKEIIVTKLEENKAASEMKANKENTQKILGIISEKEDEKLKNLSVEELKALLPK